MTAVEEAALAAATIAARPLLHKLAGVADRYPDVAETVVKILTRTVEMVARSGRPGDVAVWQRAMIAAASEFTAERTADEWLRLRLLEG